jgi:L-alanine-DL-glutamate epimerase-like enolase superfamily enzyme
VDLDALGRAARDFSVSLIEQPIARGDEAALEGWKPGVPVAADESILDLEELHHLARYFDVINIKLDKCGGLTQALHMAEVARGFGKQVMVGNMGGSTLAMAPGFVLGQLCDIVDLDGPYGLAEDPLAAQIYHDGTVFIPEGIWGFE